MRYLLSHMGDIPGEMPLALFLDYDGTLTPIVKDPDTASLSRYARAVLKRTANSGVTAVISGRALEDVKKKVRVPGIIYAGNHGMEIDFYGRVFVLPEAAGFSERLGRIYGRLIKCLQNTAGVKIEHKGITLSVHYRMACKKYIPEVRRAVYDAAGLYKAYVTSGKKVFEVRPPVKWDKGMAVRRIMRLLKKKVFPVYIGDDTTDEDAFEALGGYGITVFVGRPGMSRAGYFLWNAADVYRFLREIYCCGKDTA